MILITGGAGFIGSHLVKECLSDKNKVRVLDNFSVSNTYKVKGVEYIKGDICNTLDVSKAVKGCDTVFHLAAQLEVFGSIKDPVADLTTNTIGTICVVQACKDFGVDKLIYASSACVYGQEKPGTPIDENHPTNPNWEYGISKLAGEKYVQLFSRFWSILRYSIVYGEGEWFGRVLTHFIKRALANQTLVVFDKDVVRDYIHVSDAVRATYLSSICLPYGIMNISSGKGITILELAHKVIEVLNSKSKIVIENTEEGKASKLMPERKRIPRELKRIELDSFKATEKLQWVPKVTLESGIKAEANWYLKNRERWDSAEFRV